MNDDQRSIQDILGDFGISSDYSGYFTDPASQFDFTEEQAKQFSRFFQPLDVSKILEAEKEIEERRKTRTGFLQGEYESGFRGLTRGFGQATRQIGETAGQARFTRAGATAKQLSELQTQTRETMEDLMAGRQRSLFQIEQQYGQERAGVTRTLQDYLNRVFQRGFDIFSLDPTTPEPEGDKAVSGEPVTIGGGTQTVRDILGGLGMQFSGINRGTPGAPVDTTNDDQYDFTNRFN
tara:strand:+ start:429 stop:1136 length:708 start_codon:yes stop_codon:yes gene_type:complete